MSETPSDTAPLDAQENPLLRPWQTPLETPPFEAIRPEHFLPAFEQAFADHSAEVDAITHDPATPDFATTTPAILEIDKEVSPRMARHWNPIMMNAVLFGRIAMLHENRKTLDLTGEQMRLLERTYTN